MFDHALCGYTGSDISRVIFDRIGRRGKVSLGEAQYLNRVCTSTDVPSLEAIAHLGVDAEARSILHAAVLNAGTR